jgi:acetoin utilization protein AcuB
MAKPTLVRDVMTADPVVIGPEGTVRDAWRTMKTQGFRHLPVVENGKVVGLLSNIDVGRLGATSPQILSLVIRDAMNLEPVTVAPDVSIEAAAAKMAVKKVNCLLVLEGEKLSGIVTTYDLLDALARRLRGEE